MAFDLFGIAHEDVSTKLLFFLALMGVDFVPVQLVIDLLIN